MSLTVARAYMLRRRLPAVVLAVALAQAAGLDQVVPAAAQQAGTPGTPGAPYSGTAVLIRAPAKDGTATLTRHRDTTKVATISAGATGKVGIKGLQGLQGNRGAKGADGRRGDRGDPGLRGLKGDDGPKGFTGDPCTP